MTIQKLRGNAAVWFFALIFSCVLLLILTSCGNYEIPDDPSPAVSEPSIQFENSLSYASIIHGLQHPETGPEGRKALEYYGGEFSVDYQIQADGKGKNVGFLLFLNGKPQPYHVEEGAADTYLHIFELEQDDVPLPFQFFFTPIEGKQGNTLPLTILSIYNPAFQPDMIETSSYGMYHHELPFSCQIHFNANAGPSFPNTGRDNTIQGVMNVSARTEKLTDAFLKEELAVAGYGETTLEQTEQQTYQTILYHGKMVYDNLLVTDGGKVQIAVKLCGPAGSEYETTFYLNHQPVAAGEALSFPSSLEKGGLYILEAELDASLLEDLNTFYAVTVPSKGTSEPAALKTLSILFYKES